MTHVASYSRIFKIALPIMASNAMVPLLGLVDAGVIGRLGEVAPLAAVGLGAAIFASVIWLFNFLHITVTAGVGKARAKNDQAREAAVMARALGLVVGLLPLLALLGWWLVSIFPSWYGISSEVAPHFQTYIFIRMLASPLGLLSHVLTGYLLAYERTGLILRIELSSQVVNLGLNILFVLGLGWGVAGVAWATVIADVLWVVLAVRVLKEPLKQAIKLLRNQRISLPKFDHHNQNASALFIRALVLNATIHTFNFFSTGLGDEVLAINAVLMIFVNLTANATDGFAIAVEVLTAQAIGLRDKVALRMNFLRSSLVSGVITCVLALIFLLFGDMLFAVLSTNESLRVASSAYWPWVALSVFVGILCWSLDGVFFGSELGKEMMIIGVIAFAIFAIVAWVGSENWGNHGLWLAFALSYLLRTIGLALYYPRVERLISDDLISSINPKP